MGNFICKRPPIEQRILMQGLDDAGKTSILYKLKLGEIVTTIPTIGFNVESLHINNIDLTCWDLGCRDKMRPLHRHYYPNTQGFVFVIDSTDTERMDEAFDEFITHCLNVEITRGTVVMVLANKQDLDGALTCEEVEKRWMERKMDTDHKIFFRPCSVKTGEGLTEAFEEFVSQLMENKRHKEETELAEAAARHEISLNLLMKSPTSFVKSILLY